MGRLIQQVVVPMMSYHHGAENFVCHKPSLEEIIADALFEAKQRSSMSPSVCRSERQRSPCQPPPSVRRLRFTTTGIRKPWIQVLDMSGFRPSDIKIKIDGDSLVIHGRKEMKQGDNVDLIERKRVVAIPDDVNRSRITCHVNQQGHFIIRGIFKCNTRDIGNKRPESTKSADIEAEAREQKLNTSTEQTHDKCEDKSDVIEDDVHITGKVEEDSKPSGEYVVTEVADESDDESDKKSVASFADFIVDCLTNEVNQNNDVGSTGSGSPVPSEDFVVLDNSTNDRETVDVDTVSEDGESQHHAKLESSELAVMDGNKSFSVKLNLKDYPSDKIKVQCKDSTLLVDAEREWKDGDMLRSQKVHRMYQLPQNAEKSEARAFVDDEGQFSITVPVTEKKSEETVDITVVKE